MELYTAHNVVAIEKYLKFLPIQADTAALWLLRRNQQRQWVPVKFQHQAKQLLELMWTKHH